MTFRFATATDCPLLAGLNHQLIHDEGHRNAMTLPQLEERMRELLAGEHRAVIFENADEVVAYALFREQPHELYLRQFFVLRHKRRQGVGRRAIGLLLSQIWPNNKRLTVEVLAANEHAVAFWHAVGYKNYALTLEMMPSA